MNRNYNALGVSRDTMLKKQNALGSDSGHATAKKWSLLSFLMLLLLTGFNSIAQVNVTGAANTTPTMSASYPTLAAAITDVNNRTAISGPVTLTLTAAETAPAGGYSINNAGITGGSNTNRFIFDGGGNTITAGVGTSTTTDAFFKIIGTDFITLTNFVMNESASNTTATTQIEWGVGILYGTSTNGSQNIVLQGNTIVLNRTNLNSIGIYSNSTHTATNVGTGASATTAAGANSGLRIYSNNISNVNQGIIVVGPTAIADANTGIEIGGTGLGNTITNFGTNTTSSYVNVSGTVNGILIRNSNGYVISNNTISSSNGGVVGGTLNGIQQTASTAAPTATFTNNINNNTISLRSGVAGGAMNGINIPSGSASTTSTLNINGNDFNTWGHTVAASGVIQFIINASVHANTSINNNTFTNISVNTTGNVTFISNSISAPAAGTKTANGNSIVGTFAKTGAGGIVSLYTDGGSSVCTTPVQNNNNNFSNITLTGATSMTGWFNNDGTGSTPQKEMNNNTFSNWTCGSSAVTVFQSNFGGSITMSGNTISNISASNQIVGINQGSSGTIATTSIQNNSVSGLAVTGAFNTFGILSVHASTAVNIVNNTIRNLSSSLASVAGIQHTGGATNGVFSKNTVSDLLGNSTSSQVFGIVVSGPLASTISNNRIGDLRAPAANIANALLGISIGSAGTTHNVYYNTVNLAGTSSGALFGSSAISVSTAPTVNLNNNVFINTSVASGAGLSVAYRRSSTTLTSHGATSDRNDFFAPTIYTDGTTPQATIAAYKALVGPTRDANSISVNPNFLSTVSGNANFLKIDPAIASQLESGAANISGITDDFEGTIRQGNPGYLTQVNGGGTAPDMGADEFDGIPAPVCSGTPVASTINGASTVCSGTGTTLSLSSLYTDLGITYQWVSGTTPGGPYPNTLGTGNTQATGNLTATTYYVCTITCTNSGLSYVTAEKAVVVNPLPTVAVTPNTGSICTPGGAAITLVASGASTYSWSPAAGLSATTGDTVVANPTSTTTYTVTGTDVNGCVNTATAVITVIAKPDAVTISPANPTICSGATQMLTAAGGGSVGTSTSIGSGTSFTSAAADGPTAFNNRRINYVGQYIYTAAELSAAGVTPGNITSLAFNISANGDATTNANYTVKIGHVGTTSTFPSTAFFSNATYTTVYGPSTYTHAAPGWQEITFTSPFVWNGTDNICVDVRHDGIDSINNAPTQFTTTAGNATLTGFNTPASGTLSTSRLNIRLGYSNPATNIVWSPITDLYTDAGATVAYTGSPSTNVVYAKVTSTQAYVATSTNAGGCTNAGNVTVTVSAGAAITTSPSNVTRCATDTATFTVVATGPGLTYQWRKGGNPLSNGGNIAGADTDTLTLSNVSAADMDTYDVVVSSSCGSPVTSTGATLTVSPLPATVSVSGAGTFCTSTTITASNGGDGTIYFQGTTAGGASTATPSSSEVVTASGTYYFRALSSAGCWGAEGSVAVVIETAPGITGTNANICQGTSGTIAAVAANDCTSLQPAGTTLSGAWTATSPSADRPSTSTNSATCSFAAGNARNYDVKSFQVNVAGTYTFEMNNNTAYDGMGYLVSGAFVPGSCASGTFIKGDDDSGVTDNEPLLTATLTPGVTYTLVSTNWDTAVLVNTYTWTVTPPSGGQLVLPTPGSIQWYTTASGGSPIGSGSPFNPVGVAGSGLADTDTPGTTTYYAACSSASSCRVPVNFVINPNITNPTTTVTSCGPYTWSVNGQTYSTSGTYTSVNNCVTDVLALTVNTYYAHNTNTGLNYCSIQSAINDAATLNGHTITVDAGTFTEDVLVNKNVTISGAGQGLTVVSGPIGGGGSTFQVASGNVVIENLTITRQGNNTTDWNNPALNTAGVAVQGLTSKVELRYCEITGMRTGIDINNSNGNNIHNNNIHFNRTGMILRNQTDNTVVLNNFVTDNWTAGILFLDASGGTNIPVQSAANSSFNDNNISGNWYAQVVDRQVGGSLPAAGSNLKNFTCNWYGTTSPVITTANSTEPGYAAQIPAAFGGSASAPGGQPDIAGAASANITYAPLAISGVDSDSLSNTGWQPSAPCAAPCNLVVSATSTAIVCNGGTSTVTVSATGGSGNYTGTGTFTVTAGTYTYTVTDLNGCVDSETITITEPAASTGTTTATACDSYTWSGPLGNGMNYTTSGTYTNVTTNGSGCLHTETLVLTINNSTTNGTATITSTGPYTWAGPLGSGLTYTNSGVYTNTTTNAAGCPNVATLTLTVLPVNSFVIGTSCGATITNLAVTVIAPTVPGATTYTFRITNTVTNAVLVVNRPVNSLALSNYAGITLGTQYTIEVSTNGGATYGATCTIVTPAPTSTIGAQCGTTLTSLSQFVYATYAASVTGYRFRITNNTTNAVQVYDALSGQNRFSFSQLPTAFVSFGTTYSVEVALKNTDGNYLPYGTACNITTPLFPTSEIVLSQCDMVATSNSQIINAVVVPSATNYRFQLVNSSLSYSFSIDRTASNFSLSLFPGLQPGTTYTVRVAVRIGGVWGPLTGKPCNVTTPGTAPGGERTVVANNNFKAIAYPNPFANNFMFDVQTMAENTIQVRVYDMLGKQVENRNVEASEINSLQFGDAYPSGVYNVVVSQGENTQTLRVIKR